MPLQRRATNHGRWHWAACSNRQSCRQLVKARGRVSYIGRARRLEDRQCWWCSKIRPLHRGRNGFALCCSHSCSSCSCVLGLRNCQISQIIHFSKKVGTFQRIGGKANRGMGHEGTRKRFFDQQWLALHASSCEEENLGTVIVQWYSNQIMSACFAQLYSCYAHVATAHPHTKFCDPVCLHLSINSTTKAKADTRGLSQLHLSAF